MAGYRLDICGSLLSYRGCDKSEGGGAGGCVDGSESAGREDWVWVWFWFWVGDWDEMGLANGIIERSAD